MAATTLFAALAAAAVTSATLSAASFATPTPLASPARSATFGSALAFAIAALTATLPDPLLWPLLACPLLPMDAFGTDLHLLLNLRALMCVMFCGSRVVMIATLGQMLLVCCAISSGCHVCKTGASCRV